MPDSWTPVATALPPEDEDVLLFWGKSFPCDVGLWNGRAWQRANDDMSEYDADPTHWTALPGTP